MMEKCEAYKELVEKHNETIPDFIHIVNTQLAFLGEVYCGWGNDGNKYEKTYKIRIKSGSKFLVEID